MPKRNDIEELYEFRILFNHEGSDFVNDRHFTATNADSALEMFDFVCRKEESLVEIKSIERWNRWADRWENTKDLITHEPTNLVS